MDQTLARAWERMVDAKCRVLRQAGGHPPELRARRPGATQWSMEDVVEHLVLAEAGMTSALAKEPAPDRPRVVAPGRWYRMPALRVALLTGFRIKAPVDTILPRGDTSWDELGTRWAAGRARLLEWLEGAPPTILEAPRFRHPIIGWLTVEQALTFAGDHLEHHRMQIDRLERRFAAQ